MRGGGRRAARVFGSAGRVGEDVPMVGKRATVNSPEGGGAERARTRNPWGQGDRLRAEILAAAGHLLGELGSVDGLTLRGVARQVGIAPASIYAHFSDKSGLVAALLEHEYQELLARMNAAADEVGVEVGVEGASAGAGSAADLEVARLRARLHGFCRYSLENPGHYRVLFGLKLRRDPRRTSARLLLDSLADSLHACEAAGRRLRLPAERAAIVLLVSAHGRVAIYHDRDEGGEGQQVLEFADELLWLVFEDV